MGDGIGCDIDGGENKHSRDGKSSGDECEDMGDGECLNTSLSFTCECRFSCTIGIGEEMIFCSET